MLCSNQLSYVAIKSVDPERPRILAIYGFVVKVQGCLPVGAGGYGVVRALSFAADVAELAVG